MITIQIKGKMINNGRGIVGGVRIGSMNGKEFNQGRSSEVIHNDRLTTKPSNNMDKSVKLIEKRLNIKVY